MRILIVLLSAIKALAQGGDGGWLTDPEYIVAENGPCNIEREDAGSLTQDQFESRYAYTVPVILTNFDNSRFRELTARETILAEWGDKEVHLNSANTYSYRRVPTTFATYINDYLKPQSLDKLGNETLYLFGDIDQKVWKPLLKQYIQPPWKVPGHTSALSFGIAGAGTGVPFHFHGPGFAEVIYGRKRWFLYPYDERPEFNPDNTTLEWFLHDYPKLVGDLKPFECVLQPGEVIYFPDRWWHATLNCETSIFISTFLSP
uniref:JmjC domain-containing protein n=1 Tax=Plectus sambesii TaxID=2011161 RepID=A0A914V3K6_9BILA